MKNKNMTKPFWILLGRADKVSMSIVDSYRKDHEIHVDASTRMMYVRKKPKNKRLIKAKRVSIYKYISILLAIILLSIAIAYVYKVKTIEYISPAGEKISLDPVRFTKEELETFYNKHSKPFIAHASDGTEDVTAMIYEVFGDKAHEAIKIATCESGINADRVGDTALMVYDEKHQEYVGDSIGIFQVRTGGLEKNGKLWNRARSNGMTADEYRIWLKDVKNNVNSAKGIYDARGWTPWANCKKKVL